MITGQDILYISSIEWTFLWQCHQEIALRLAAAGNRVLYVENTGVRTPGLRDAGRVLSRLKRWAGSRSSNAPAREVAPNLYLCSPLVMPPFGSRWRRKLNKRFFLKSVANHAQQLGMKDPLVWTYLPTDTALDLISLVRTERSLVVYYGVADFSQLTKSRKRLQQSEQKLLETADVVFTNCNELAYRFSRWNRNAHVFAPGVNLAAFPESVTHEVESSRGAGPRIGYIGGLHRFVDYKLLREMALARPEWSWVLVGAAQTNLDQLQDLPNVSLVGQQPHEVLVHYLHSFDVCLVPYLNTPQLSTVVPTKINEYLAAGRPVVSTNLPTVVEFNEEHRILETARPEAVEFLRAIESVLIRRESEIDRARRREVAALADWQVRLEQMSGVIEEQMAGFDVPLREKKAIIR